MRIQTEKMMQNALIQMSEGSFEQTATVLNDTRIMIVEDLKKQTLLKMKAIIGKLSGSDDLTKDEIALIELWVVGDAESASSLEDDFQDSLSEFKKLSTTLANYDNKECDLNDLFKLLGLLEDASHISFTIAAYLEKKDRISRFKSAVAEGLDGDERRYLVEFLNGKMHSEEI